MGRAPDYPDEKSAIPGCPTEKDEDPDTTGTLSSGCLSMALSTFSNTGEIKNVTLSCVILMAKEHFLQMGAIPSDQLPAILSAMETTLTADKIKSWINESSMKSDQVDSVSVYVSMCDDKNNCNAMPENGKKAFVFGIGKYNIEDIENDSSAVVQKLMTVFQAFCEKVMSKMVGVWGCSSPEVLAAGDDKKEGNKRLKRSTGEEADYEVQVTLDVTIGIEYSDNDVNKVYQTVINELGKDDEFAMVVEKFSQSIQTKSAAEKTARNIYAVMLAWSILSILFSCGYH
ncbi:uncharacterized protein LOC134841386 isoform X2 [Symsagittifera roscoffensis]